MKSLSATSELTFTDALFIMVIGSLGMIVPVQGGIGAYHSMVVIGFALYNIPKEDSFAYAVISHESQMVMLIIGGALSFFLMSFNRKKKERKTF
jgi:uncharacterized membrane protein YbhN (UPF0104 family)